MEPKKKPWRQSKTLWFNAASAAFIALEASLHLMQGSIPDPKLYLALAMFIAAVNAALRFATTQGIEQ